MVKKLLLINFILPVLFLFSWSGYGQNCPDAGQNSTISISTSKTNICAGEEITISSTVNFGGSTPTFRWLVNDVPLSGETSKDLITSALTQATNKVVLEMTTDCTDPVTVKSNVVTITANPNRTPNVSLSADKTSLCPSESITFTTSNAYGGTNPQFSWYINSSNSVAKTGATATFSGSEFSPGSNTVKVVMTSDFSCVTTTTAEVTSAAFTLKDGIPAQPGAITGSIAEAESICPNTSLSYSVTPVDNATAYIWTLPGGWTGSSTTNSISVTSGSPGSGTISVFARNSCGDSAPQTFDVTVKAGTPAVPGTISGKTEVCPGVSENYSITAVPGAEEYIWTLPDGSEQTTTTTSIDITTSASGSSNISVRASNSCGTSAAKALTVTVKPGTPSIPQAISGNLDVCPGVSETYVITPAVTGATSYIWTLPDGWTGTSTTSSITVTTGTAAGNITVKATNDCGTSEALTQAVNVKAGTPAMAALIHGATTVCPETSETFSVDPIPGATSYIWTLPSGWSGSSTSESITVTTGSAGGAITVKATNDCGTGEAKSMTITVSDPAPVMTGTITGPEVVCSGSTGNVYTIPEIENATSYVWSIPSDWTITGAPDGNSITVTAGTTNADIKVIAQNSCGDSDESVVLYVISTTGKPSTPGAITSNLPSTAICPPFNNVLFSVDAVPNATGYNWILPDGWEIISGEDTPAITVNITANAKYSASASISVQATNICGSSASSTLSGIAIDNFVVARLGEDQVFCKSTATLSFQGYVAFGSNNSKLKITSLTSSGTNQPKITSNGNNFNEFDYTYTPSTADLEAGKVTLILTTEKPGGACDVGKDEMVITFKPLPSATISATSPVCAGNTATLSFTGTPNSQVTYKKDGGANRTVVIDASGTATVETEALTASSTFSLVGAVNLDTPACTATLTGVAPAAVTVTPIPTISSFAYTGSPFCSSDTTVQMPTLTGTNAFSNGTYSSTSGLSINTETGEINPEASTPGTYVVTYATPAAAGCESVTATTEVTINALPTASISYANTLFCTSDSTSQTATLTGTNAYSGGTYSAPDGLTIDPATGTITASSSTAGAYTVSYSTPAAGGCPAVVATTDVVITMAPTATISYEGAPFCQADNSLKEVTLTGTDAYTGGSYSAPSGLTLNVNTGSIVPNTSTPGTYTVTYTVPASAGCDEVQATTEITITETPDAEISYAGPFCTSDSTLQPVTFSNTVGAYEGGTFTANEEGLDGLNATTGEINAQISNPGTYTVTYHIPEGQGCGVSEITTSVTINQYPQATLSYETPLCTSDTGSYAPVFTGATNNFSGGTFSATAGLTIDAEGTITPETSTSGVHTITYTFPTPDGCGDSETTAQVEIFAKPVITAEPQNLGICSSNPASFEVTATGDDLHYQWYHKPAEGSFSAISGATSRVLSFTNATSKNAGEYYVEVSGSSPCGSTTSETVVLNVDEEIVIIKPTEDQTFCDKEITTITFEFIAHANNAPLSFTWIKDGVEITPDNSKYFATVSDPAGENGEYTGELKIDGIGVDDNGVYAVKINGPEYFTCSEAVSKTFALNINPLPEPPATDPIVYCKGDTAVPLIATGESGAVFRWYNSEFGTDFISEAGPVPNTTEAGTTVYWVSQKTETCESLRTKLEVTVLDKPGFPDTSTSVNYCFNAPTTKLSATGVTGATINWYASEDSETPLETAPTPSSDEVGVTSYWVSQSTPDACESDKLEVIVTIEPLPNTSATADNSVICFGSSTTLHATGGDSFIWFADEVEIGTGADILVSPEETTTYTVTGSNNNGCKNSATVTITVDQPSFAGTLAGGGSVCARAPNGTLELTGNIGNIVRWEYKGASATVWTEFTDGNLTASRNFAGLTETTSFRVTVLNGTCEEVTTETTVIVDPIPVGGILAFDLTDTTKDGRIFLTCEKPGSDYAVDLNLSGHEGEIVAWRFKPSTSSTWSTVMVAGEPYTEPTLTAAIIEDLKLAETVQTTVFAVEIKSGACSPNVLSKAALFSVIPADIEPSPVTVDPAVICIGDTISLSGQSGYSADGGNFSGGAFDNAGIVSDGWRFSNLEGGSNDFNSAADNGRPDHWLRTTPKDKFYTANITTLVVTPQIWDSKLAPEGNDGFAIVTGNNASLMETPVFTLDGLDEAILTFDQAYNLTQGDSIFVELSTNGGISYEVVLFEMGGPSSSGYYDTFGDGTPESRPLNKMVIDLKAYSGLPNLRIRFNFIGKRDGTVWAVDNIKVPDGPQDAQLIWYYDDPSTPPGDLEQIGEINQEVVPFVPEYIGWNSFQVQTELILDSAGNTCHSIENERDVQVFVYDKYTLDTQETVGTCGSNTVELRTDIVGLKTGPVTNFPTPDGFIGQWKITDEAGVEVTEGYELTNLNASSTLAPINDPNVLFTAEDLDTYIFTYELVSDGSAVYPDDYYVDTLRGEKIPGSACPPDLDPITVEILDCTTLDFDGVDDYIDLGTAYNTGTYSIEAWIRPFEREISEGVFTDPSIGTIIAGPGFEIKMQDLPETVIPGTRWYHIAVTEGELYIDGIHIGAAGSGHGETKTLIGARWNTSGEPENYFSGWIEEVRIWKTPLTEKQIRFMLNQRINEESFTASTPIQGEIIKVNNIGSYKVDGSGFNLDEDGDVWHGKTWGELAGYYRLISLEPDPLPEPIVRYDHLKPINGNTPNLANEANPGRLHNMTTHQQNTSPLPYLSGADGIWHTNSTWLRPSVWSYPNEGEIDWNIAQTSHNISSDNKDIDLLGLISVTNTLDMLGTIPSPSGNELYVSHYLKLDGVVDLNGESQLVQPDGSLASGTGYLERDQQGTASSYNYNYWSSPVIPAFGDSEYSVAAILFDGTLTGTGMFRNISFKPGPFSADNPRPAANTNITISNYWIFSFAPEGSEINANMYSKWNPEWQTGTMMAGEGFTMKGSWDIDFQVAESQGLFQNYTFKGFPNNGDMEMKTIHIDQNYLIGNPFPSAIIAQKFIEDNKDAINGAVYFWHHFGGMSHYLKEYVGGYATWNYTAGVPAASVDERINNNNTGSGRPVPGPFIPVGQGFFINSTVGDGTQTPKKVVFNNTQRIFVTEADGKESYFHSQEELSKKKVKQQNKTPLIRLNFNSPKGYWRQIAVGANPVATNAVDYGYDAPLLDNNSEDMFWMIGDKKYVIQGVADFNLKQVLPLGIKISKAGKFSIKVAALDNLPENTRIFIHDKLYDLYYNISEREFSAKMEPGEYYDRFQLVFEEPLLIDDRDIILPGEFEILYVNGTREIKLRNPKLQKISKVHLNNVLGQQVHVYHHIPTEHEVDLPVKRFSSGVYIVKVYTDDGVISKKIILE